MNRVLIIDDDTDFLLVMRKFLSRKGYEVRTLEKWLGASEQIKVFKPQIIILDIFLPDQDGLQACKTLKSSRYTRKIPVVIVSGYAMLRQNALEEFGAEAFMAKPFAADALAGIIHNQLARA